MNAKEASEITKKALLESPLEEVLNIIEAAAKKGEYRCFYYKSMNDEVRKALLSRGFKVGKTMYDRNEVLTEIRWC